MKVERCRSCGGEGKVRECVNPDNGFLDTQVWNLRYEVVTCASCKGTGRVEIPDARPDVAKAGTESGASGAR